MGSVLLVVELPLTVVSVANLREHWSVKAKRTRSHREAFGLLTRAKIIPSLPVVVTLTRIAPRELDDDNLQSAFKAIRDGVADRMGVKDNDKRVRWLYGQERGRAKQYSARVTITPVDDVVR